MKIQPVASPHAMIQPQTTNNSDARSRAIAKLTAAPAAPTTGNAQQEAVANPNQVSVEELSAITGSQTTETTDNNTEVSEVTEQVTPEVKPEDTPEGKRWAQLARQERALRAKAQQQDQAYKAREQALATREAELSTKSQVDMTKYVPRERIKQDALAVLAEEGLSYEALTQDLLSRQPVDPRLQATINDLQAEIKSLKAANETSTKTYQEQQQASYQAAVRQIDSDARALVKSNPGEYEAIAKTGSEREIVKLIEETYNKDGVLMTVEEAAQEVENYLIEESLKLTSIEKIKKRMSAASATQKATEVKTQTTNAQPQQMKTLTNATASTRKLSARERALLAFKGELGKG